MNGVQLDWLRRMGSFGALAMFLLALAGCSSIVKPVKGYDGPELPDAQTATLEASETVKVVSINGRDTTSFLLEDIELDYSLKPGPNTVVFKYRSIWSRNRARQNDEAAVDTVESGLVEVRFDAQAGETYTFAHNGAENVREAQRLARGFTARVVSSKGRVVARSNPYTGEQQTAEAPSAPPSNSRANVSNGTSSNGAVSPVAPNMSTGDALKLLWKRATREEKEAFLREAFE